ncbi:hypothetical protein [Streptomyces antimycoticus]|uniref:hypothetical protein n=1 Tax=Streptomyces antimycoticus TaxID=68175 RepID=UPI00257010F9|nr:hypothetical protein [Streptomyces antimycoticus]WJD95974.1 hypothetical protein QR300_08180 [Streptomyces antimycoticus]
MSEQESGAEAASVGPFPSIGSERDPEATAAALADAVSAGWSCVVTVGVPLCSDGTNAWFGSGIYDPFSERTLLTPPEGLSAEGESDLRFAQAVAERLQALRTAGPGSVTFSLSIFDGKMVHGIGRAAARRMHSNITAGPEEFLPPAALALYHAVGGRLAFDFSLNYRKLGDRFVDRLRGEVRPVIPSVPTGRLIDLFLGTGCVPLRRVDASQPTPGMGQVLCATPNTLSVGQHLADLSPLDGRGRIQTGPEAVPLTNENGAYICEVTAIGRLLAMLAHAPAPADGGGVLTLSVLNTRDPGNHKIHRMSWSAGELVTALLPYLRPDSWARRPLVHWASVTDGETSAAIGSAPDTLARQGFLAGLRARIQRSSSPRRREEIIAGELERIRMRVQNADPAKAPLLFLYGPGDYGSYRASGVPAPDGTSAASDGVNRPAPDTALSQSCFLN